MSALKSSKVQVGISTNVNNNFVIDASQADGSIKISRGNIGATTQEVLKVDSTGAMSTLGLPAFQCRAWVVFDGTGTPSILGSGNVSSVTKVATGHYRINFTTPFADLNYCVTASGQWDTSTTNLDSPQCGIYRSTTAINTGYVEVVTVNASYTPGDSRRVCVTIFR